MYSAKVRVVGCYRVVSMPTSSGLYFMKGYGYVFETP